MLPVATIVITYTER